MKNYHYLIAVALLPSFLLAPESVQSQEVIWSATDRRGTAMRVSYNSPNICSLSIVNARGAGMSLVISEDPQVPSKIMFSKANLPGLRAGSDGFVRIAAVFEGVPTSLAISVVPHQFSPNLRGFMALASGGFLERFQKANKLTFFLDRTRKLEEFDLFAVGEGMPKLSQCASSETSESAFDAIQDGAPAPSEGARTSAGTSTDLLDNRAHDICMDEAETTMAMRSCSEMEVARLSVIAEALLASQPASMKQQHEDWFAARTTDCGEAAHEEWGSGTMRIIEIGTCRSSHMREAVSRLLAVMGEAPEMAPPSPAEIAGVYPYGRSPACGTDFALSLGSDQSLADNGQRGHWRIDEQNRFLVLITERFEPGEPVQHVAEPTEENWGTVLSTQNDYLILQGTSGPIILQKCRN